MIELEKCRLLIAEQPREWRHDPSMIETLYSDENVRILKTYNFEPAPDGEIVVRVDIFK